MLDRILLLFDKYPLDFISQLSSILPIVVGLFTFKHLNKNIKIILLLFCMYFIGDTYMIWLGIFQKNNLFILNIYPIGIIILLTAAYVPIFISLSAKRLVVSVAIVFLLTCIANFKIFEISSVDLFLCRIYTIALMLLYFNNTLSDMRVKNILIHSQFWISSGLIIYATGTFFISIFSEFIFNPNLVDDTTFNAYWNLNNVLFLILVAFSSIGIWLSKCDQENLL